MYRTVGHHGWGQRGGWGYGHGPHGFVFLPGLLLMGLVFFGLFKFLLPVMLVGLALALVSGFWRHGRGGRAGRGFWNERWNWEHERYGEFKRKNDWGEKPKHEDDDDRPRYTRTANGDWVEII